MYLGPTERPPEEPDVKPPRPPFHVRLYRRLCLYWSSPPKGDVCVFCHKLRGGIYSSNREGFFSALLFCSLIFILVVVLVFLYYFTKPLLCQDIYSDIHQKWSSVVLPVLVVL